MQAYIIFKYDLSNFATVIIIINCYYYCYVFIFVVDLTVNILVIGLVVNIVVVIVKVIVVVVCYIVAKVILVVVSNKISVNYLMLEDRKLPVGTHDSKNQ